MNLFVGSFWALCIICFLLYLYARTSVPGSTDARFTSFQRTYLAVYILAMGKWPTSGKAMMHLYSNSAEC